MAMMYDLAEPIRPGEAAPEPARSVFQLGFRANIEANLALSAVRLGAEEVKFAQFLERPEDEGLGRLEQAVLSEGAVFSVHPLPAFDIPSRNHPLSSELVICDDIIFHLEDPYHVLVQLRHLARERFIVTTAVLPSVPPSGWVTETEWMVPSRFFAFAGALSENEYNIIAAAFKAYGMDHTPYATQTLEYPKYESKLRPGAWRWIWTDQAFEDMIDSAGFRIAKKLSLWDARGFLYDCV